MSVRAPRRGAQVVRGVFRRRRLRVHDPDAFKIWRLAVGAPDDVRCAATLSDLTPILLFADPRWRSAVDGDPGAAVGLALEHVWSRRIEGIRRDLILAVLWTCASAGDPASKLLLAVLRERVDEARRA